MPAALRLGRLRLRRHALPALGVLRGLGVLRVLGGLGLLRGLGLLAGLGVLSGLGHVDRLLGGRPRALGRPAHRGPGRGRVRDAAVAARSVQLAHGSPRLTAGSPAAGMAPPRPLAAFVGRPVTSLTCLLARRRAAAFAGVVAHISFAPLPAPWLLASLTRGTLVPTSGAFAQFGV